MVAPGFSFLLFLGIFGYTVGSESEPSSVSNVQDSIKSLTQKVLQLDTSMASMPQTIQAEYEQLLITVLDEMEIKLENYASTNKVSEMGEALRKEFQALLSNQTLQMTQMSKQVEDLQNSCFGEPPSTRNGSPMDFERKHGSKVGYQCDQDFFVTGNSTVRCSFGKWVGQPTVCSLFHKTFILRAHLEGHLPYILSNVTCSSEENFQKIEFSRILDRGTDLPSGVKLSSTGRATVLDLSRVSNVDRRGAYQCGYKRDGKLMGITFVISAVGYFVWPQVASIGDDVKLHSGYTDNPYYRWLHDDEFVHAGTGLGKLLVPGVRKDDAGIYERYHVQDRRRSQYYTWLVVRRCPRNFFGDRCDQECPPCYNGGTCHDLLGICVCPPGFAGSSCEVACGQNRFGPNCSQSCDGGDCKSQVFCKPDSFGCSCAAGYGGHYCHDECKEGEFGAHCKETCHCADGPCDPYTGACPGGCSPGWAGPSCQIPAGN